MHRKIRVLFNSITKASTKHKISTYQAKHRRYYLRNRQQIIAKGLRYYQQHKQSILTRQRMRNHNKQVIKARNTISYYGKLVNKGICWNSNTNMVTGSNTNTDDQERKKGFTTLKAISRCMPILKVCVRK